MRLADRPSWTGGVARSAGVVVLKDPQFQARRLRRTEGEPRLAEFVTHSIRRGT
jgi:hypothetical protein